MTVRDAQYLAKLRDYYAVYHVLPSFAAVAKLVGFRSTSAVAAMVGRLKREGFLESSPERRLQPGKRFFESVLADSVQAGMPQPANEGPSVGYDIMKRLVKVPSRTVLLKVRGESMIDVGLMPGDYVVVQKGAEAKLGDIVVAMVDREYTVKYLAQDHDGIYLRAGNKEYRDIRPKESLETFGVVVGSFREYRGP